MLLEGIKKNPYKIILLLVGSFFLIDFICGMLSTHFQLPERVVDIQSPTSLYYKLDYLKNFKGKKIVFIGDSVVYGRSMEEHGDKKWEDHTIPAQFLQLLESHGVQGGLLVLNMGMNGALPADLKELVRILALIDVDLIIMDVTLRSFSKDFEDEKTSMSRRWLAHTSISATGDLILLDQSNDFYTYIENRLIEIMTKYSNLYRMRDFIQWFLFNTTPNQAVINLRKKLNDFLVKEKTAQEDPFVLILKAKSRHKKISFAADNVQLSAFKDLLASAKGSNKKLIIFYATENQRHMQNILSTEQYKSYLGTLEETIRKVNPSATYIPPQRFSENYYDDYVHLNKEGCAFMSRLLYDCSKSLVD